MKKRRAGTVYKEFLQEAYVWMAFNRRDPENLRICPLLCTFEIEEDEGTQFYLLFPRASGNLVDLWFQCSLGRTQSALDCIWFANELWKLSETLRLVHNNDGDDKPGTEKDDFGRFGDIKPANILWFGDHHGCDNAGSLVFTDLGMAKSHKKLTKSRSFAAKTGHSETYKAPEFAYADNKFGIGRKADIWSFGCTLIEHITWYLLGHNEIERDSELYEQLEMFVSDLNRNIDPTTEPKFDFTDGGMPVIIEQKTPIDLFADIREEPDRDHENFSQDRFFSLSPNKDQVYIRRTVVAWIDFLHRRGSCSLFLHDLLYFIHHRMLDVNCHSRATAREVELEMKEFVRKLDIDRRYGTRRSDCRPECFDVLKHQPVLLKSI